LKNYLNKFFKKNLQIIPFVPDNTRIYCVGDIHGRNDLLRQLLMKVMRDFSQYEGSVIIVYLGDYVDRGLHSKQVIETLLNNQKTDVEYVYLRGNHEQVMLDCLQNATIIPSWLSFGGQSTLASYGVGIAKIPTKREELLEIQTSLKECLPIEHYQFLTETQLSYTLGSYFFVHAGVNPKKSLARQCPEDLLWIRDEFINVDKAYKKIIVHGHTVTEEPEILKHRIGIDTGAYASGILSCLVLESNQQKIIQTDV